MPVPRPFNTVFQSHYTRLTPSIHHVLDHRWTTWLLALSILLDNAVIIVPGLVTAHLLIEMLGAPQYTLVAAATLALISVMMIGWNVAWLRWHSPILSTLLWGGTVYVIEEPSERVGLTTKIGVAEHPNVRGVVEAIIPGVLFFSTPGLRPYKPNYLPHTEIKWTEIAVLHSLKAKPWSRADIGI